MSLRYFKIFTSLVRENRILVATNCSIINFKVTLKKEESLENSNDPIGACPPLPSAYIPIVVICCNSWASDMTFLLFN
jgi:hypothetical protein